MQTEAERGPFPLQDSPAHLLERSKHPSDSNGVKPPPTFAFRPEVQPDSLGAFRGAVFCLPIGLVMWAIIIAAVLHFLIF